MRDAMFALCTYPGDTTFIREFQVEIKQTSIHRNEIDTELMSWLREACSLSG